MCTATGPVLPCESGSGYATFLLFLFTRPFHSASFRLVSMAGSSTQVRRLWEAGGREVSSGPAKFLVWLLRKVFFCSLPKRWRGRGEVGNRGAAQGSQGHPSPRGLGTPGEGGLCFRFHFSGVGGNLIRYFHGVIWGGSVGENTCYRSLYLGRCSM